MPRILVADDHAIFRRRVIQAIAKSFPRFSMDEAGGGWKALALVKKGRYALILLDISTPGRGGLEALEEIKRRCPDTHVLVLGMHSEEEYAVRALRAGASGYVTKDRIAEELAGAIRAVLAGSRYVSSSVDGSTEGKRNGTDPCRAGWRKGVT